MKAFSVGWQVEEVLNGSEVNGSHCAAPRMPTCHSCVCFNPIFTFFFDLFENSYFTSRKRNIFSYLGPSIFEGNRQKNYINSLCFKTLFRSSWDFCETKTLKCTLVFFLVKSGFTSHFYEPQGFLCWRQTNTFQCQKNV